MKKTLIALSVLAASGAAMAQSTVTLYGIVDVNLQSVKRAAVDATGKGVAGLTQIREESGGQNGSRWGLKGSEDLGGGLKAVFDLQSGINVDTGSSAQGGLLFGRHAFVGLSNSVGTLTFGRHDTPLDDMFGDVLPSGTNIFSATNGPGLDAAGAAALKAGVVNAAYVSALNNFAKNDGAWTGYNSRADNSIKFISNNFAGFTVSALYALGENKSATSGATNTTSLAGEYANGPITAVLAYQNEVLTRSPSTISLRNILAGGAYDFGVLKLSAAVNEAKLTDSPQQKEYALGVAVPVGALTLRAEIAQSKGDLLGKSTGYDLEALYDLSKRTTLYTSYVNTKHQLANNEHTSIFGLGIRHKF